MNKRFGEKTEKERKLDGLNADILKLDREVDAQQRLILHRDSVRFWDLVKMQAEKKKLETGRRELATAKRQRDKLEDTGK